MKKEPYKVITVGPSPTAKQQRRSRRDFKRSTAKVIHSFEYKPKRRSPRITARQAARHLVSLLAGVKVIAVPACLPNK